MALSASERESIMAEQRAINAAAIKQSARENPLSVPDWGVADYLARIDSEIALRQQVIETAQAELEVLAILLETAGLSDVAQERAAEALDAVHCALSVGQGAGSAALKAAA